MSISYIYVNDCITLFYNQYALLIYQAGRLLLRRAVHTQLDIPWTDITFARTKRGKPYLANTEPDGIQGFSVNVSHHGNFTVLAASKSYQVCNDEYYIFVSLLQIVFSSNDINKGNIPILGSFVSIRLHITYL